MASEDDVSELRELVGDILVHGVTTSELTEEMVKGYSGDGVEKVIIEEAQTMIQNTDDPNKKIHIASFVRGLGMKLGSESLKKNGTHWVKQIKQQHG